MVKIVKHNSSAGEQGVCKCNWTNNRKIIYFSGQRILCFHQKTFLRVL